MQIQNKIPLLAPLTFLICGIIYEQTIPSNFYLLFSTFLISLYFTIKTKKNIATYLLIFFSGALLLNLQKNNSKHLLNKIKNKKINITATVLSKKELQNSNIKEEIQLKAKSCSLSKMSSFNLLCYTYTPTKMQPGQEVEIKNIEIKGKPLNKKNNSFQDFLLKKNVVASLFSKKLNYKILNKNINPIKQFLYKTKKRINEKIRKKLKQNSYSLFSSIFLGNKTNTISSKDKNIFNIWGITHYLARSGLHIVIFIIIWQLFLSLLPINIKIKNIFLLILSLIYLSLSWPSLSFLRAFYVFSLYQVSTLFNKQSNFLHLLTLICILILIKNPIQLFFIDFQLTFLLTFTLAISQKKYL
jgi:competence protein ComEC